MKQKSNRVLEQEANLFATLLMIPTRFIVEDLKDGFDLTDDTKFKALCDKYGVTATTMTYRISLLKKHKQI